MYRRRCGHNLDFVFDDNGAASFDYGRHHDELANDHNHYFDNYDNHIAANAVRRSL